MLIKDWMTKDPVTITDDTSMIKAIHIMKERRFRRLPVVSQGKLVGLITDRDLKEASPSKATTLDVHELYYLLAELQVKEIMSRNPISVSQDDTVERAAQIMLEHTISGLPVVDATGQAGGDHHPVGCLPGLHAHHRHPPGRGAVRPAPGRPPRPHQGSGGPAPGPGRPFCQPALLLCHGPGRLPGRLHPGQEPAPGGGGAAKEELASRFELLYVIPEE